MTNDELTNVILNIFTASICEVAEGAEAEGDEFVVEGVEFAEGRDVVGVTKQGEGTFKGAGAGD